MTRTHTSFLTRPRLAALALLLLCGCAPLRAQDGAWVDSTKALHDSLRLVPDSLRLGIDTTMGVDDSLRATGDTLFAEGDTLIGWDTVNSADTIVQYSAKDSIVYDLDAKNMKMYNDADINYGTYGIKAARVTIDWEANTMHGLGVPDTTAGREGKMMGTPVFAEGGEEYRGEEMTYNFKSKRGVIRQGKTMIDDGYYVGDKIKRMSNDVYFIKDGQYTTCDQEDHKHFYFGSPKMKIIPNDVIVAEPITFYVEDIPLLWIPFAVIPSSSGRKSGVVVPSFGEDYARGRYLKDGGYYLAASDYWDLTLTGDWYWKGGWKTRANARYNLRYNFNGSIDASYGRQMFSIGNPYEPDDLPRTDYSVIFTHNQTIDPTASLKADFNFISQGFYSRHSTNIEELVNQTADSRASFSKRWEGTNRSLTVSVSRRQDIQTDASNTTLPEISFNQSQIFPFRAEGSLGNEWYEQIGFNYSARAVNKIDVLLQHPNNDTVLNRYNRRGVNHNVGFILNPKLGYFTVSPSLNYQERWYDQRFERSWDAADRQVRVRDVNGFYALRTFNAGVNVNTKLYGLFRPDVWGIQGIRHTVQPSIGYSYNPDFSDPFWGYYQTYMDSVGTAVAYDPYTGYNLSPGAAFGGVGSGESQSITMSLSNLFEMKLDPAADDTTGEAERVKLLNLSLSTSYNLAAEEKKLAPIGLNFNTSLGELLDVSGNASFSPYVWVGQKRWFDPNGNPVSVDRGYEVDRYMADEGLGLVRMTSFGLNLRTGLNSDMFRAEPAPEDSAATDGGLLSQAERDEYNFTIKWRLGLGYSYQINQSDPEYKTKNSSIDANLSLELTPNWSISASTYYNLVSGELGTPRINITRDLHCWTMAFSWVPAGVFRQYNLVIRIKAPQLQDIKFEREGSDRGVY